MCLLTNKDADQMKDVSEDPAMCLPLPKELRFSDNPNYGLSENHLPAFSVERKWVQHWLFLHHAEPVL